MVASLLGLEMGVPFLMPNWAWVGRRRKESIVVRRKIDRCGLMMMMVMMVMQLSSKVVDG
eukprot:scaffold19383_cov100-Skeletonema_dohrnii-CCMP3373.AAC.3